MGIVKLPPVQSKHLFNYEPLGKLCDDVALDVEKNKKVFQDLLGTNPAVGELMGRFMGGAHGACKDIVENVMRPATADFLAKLKDKIPPTDCMQEEITVPIRDGNNSTVKMIKITPPKLVDEKNRVAYIYAHGGGAVSMSASDFTDAIGHAAKKVDAVLFNVDYRLGPETRCPYNALDFYCAIKHVIENSEELGVDPSRIVIGGDSGGGYITGSTLTMLARKNEGLLIKLAILGIPMIDADSFNVKPEDQVEELREMHVMQQAIWRCLAPDNNPDFTDPLLFPANASDEEIGGWPPVIIIEKEFDFYRVGARRLADRLEKQGRLLEFISYPGMQHASEVSFHHEHEYNARQYNDTVKFFDEYVR